MSTTQVAPQIAMSPDVCEHRSFLAEREISFTLDAECEAAFTLGRTWALAR
jgi:hypothetical protein